MKKYPIVRQHDEKDCGAAVVAMICRYWKLKIPLAEAREKVKTDINGTTMYGLVEGLTKLGFVTEGDSGSLEELLVEIQQKRIKFPFIARIIKDGILEHFVVIYKINKNKVVIGDPALGIINIRLDKFEEMWTGHIIQAEPGDSFIEGNHTKNKLVKYIDLVLKQKKMLLFALIVSMIISIITILGTMTFYTAVEVITNSRESEHEHEVEWDEEETDIDEDNFVEVWENRIIQWMDSNPVLLALDAMISNVDVVFGAILFLYLFRTIITILRGKALSMVSKKVENDILFESYEKLLDLPVGFFESRSTGEIMSRLDDITEICNAISSGALTLILDTLMVTITGIILMALSKELTILSVIIIWIYLCLILIFKKPINRKSNEVMQNSAIVTSMFKQTIDGIMVIKAYCQKEEKKKNVFEEYNAYTDLKAYVNVIETIQGSIATFVAVSGLVLILWRGTLMCVKGELSLSILLTYYNILNYFLTSITNLVSLQTDFQMAVTSANRLNDILDCNTERNGNRQQFVNGNIEFRNVSFRYGGGPMLIDDLNLTIKAGEKVAIIGESGCGKSTIAKLLAAYYKCETGNITIADVPLDEYENNTVRKNIMYVSGDGVIFEDTIRNNIALYNDVSFEKIKEVCKKMQLNDFIESLPYGYETLVDDSGSIFSTGQRQRINIARALLHEPNVLILDEATSNLDPLSEKRINDVINSMKGKITCIIIAHKINTIKDCDKIIIMERGKVLEIGNNESLSKNSAIYAEYL